MTMQNFVFFLVMLPIISIFVGAAILGDAKRIETVFLRSLEVAAVLLFACFLLHVTGIVTSMWQTLLGAIVWGTASALGEFSRRLEVSRKI